MLTSRQKECLDFIADQIAMTGGIAPSYQEIAVHLGLSNKSSVHRLVAGLEERGHIRRLPFRKRALEIIRRPSGRRSYFTFNDETKELSPWQPK